MWFFASLLIAQTTIQWTVGGISCDSCIKTIQKQICQKEKLVDCQVSWESHKDQTAQLVFQCPNADDCSTRIRKSLEKLGYKVLNP